MIKRTTTTIRTHLLWAVFLLILLFLAIQVMPRALGQRNISKKTLDVEAPSHPDNGNWTVTGSLNIARAEHTATLLSNGMVFVAGGFDSNNNILASAELYDPASGSWTATGSLNIARADHTATLLPNGMVLVAAGVDSNVTTSPSAELYDPASGSWTATGNLNTARYFHAATLLPDG